ncbi:MAG: DUF4367 domain-containing protein [Clostridia bacterium]|nr:DUF4367 domain-containing protein [Clostridia bacterium]
MKFYDHPNLQQAFEIYVQRQNALLPTREELGEVTFSAAFEQRMERLFVRRRYGYYRLFGTASRRVASVVVALLVSAVLVTAGVEAIRTPVVQFFTEVFKKFTRIYVADDAPALPEEMVFEPHAPAYIPDGYELESEEKLPTMYRIVYTNPETGDSVFVVQRLDDGCGLYIDTERILYNDITIEGRNGVYYENKGKIYLVFIDEQYTYTLSSVSAKVEELIKIAESIIKYK